MFKNGGPSFQAIDEFATRCKGIASVRRMHFNIDARFANRNHATCVANGNGKHIMRIACGLDKAYQHLPDERLMKFVVKPEQGTMLGMRLCASSTRESSDAAGGINRCIHGLGQWAVDDLNGMGQHWHSCQY